MRYHSGMNIVVDTGILISALLGSEGASREVIRRCLQGYYYPAMWVALFAEYEAVLGRDTLFDQCPVSPKERRELFEAFMSVARWTDIYYGWRPNLRDEGDNHLVELAVASGALFIVTNNIRDFDKPELKFPNLTVLRPADLLRRGP